mgnify:CR=1 FL=1
MPSYDKAKMMRLLEARRHMFLRTNDYSSRIRDLRGMISAKQRDMENSGNYYECRAFVDSLLKLPLEQARALKREEVETCNHITHTRSGSHSSEVTTGIGFGLWGEYLQLLERRQRLELESGQLSQSHNEQFACVASLVMAVTDWGFRSPEDEL